MYIDTHEYNMKNYWQKIENTNMSVNRGYISDLKCDMINAATICEIFMSVT